MEIANIGKDRKKRIKASPDLNTLVYGKIPPQARDLEEAILGAIMLEKDAFDRAIEIISHNCFYVDSHQRIFKAMMHMKHKNTPIDIRTVVEELRKRDELDIVGGPYFVTKLTNDVVSSANLEAHCQIMYQKFIAREVIRINGWAISEAYEDSTDAFNLLDDLSSQISNLAINKISKPYSTLAEVSQAALLKIAEIKASKQELTGVPSGIYELDSITQGFQPGNMIIIAARPSVGKSAIAANFAYNAAVSEIKPTPAAVFSLEMPSEQWAMRIMSAQSGIEMKKIKRGRVEEYELNRLGQMCFHTFSDAKVFFDDSPNLSIYQLKAKARVLVNKEKVGLIIVDYLQLMGGEEESNKFNREQEVSTISRELKHLALELKVPVIALSQLNRKGDGADPQMSHLRESGAIEQNADDVFILTDPPENVIADEPEKYKDSIIVKISKHRNGQRLPVQIRFVKEIQKIMNERDYQLYLEDKTIPQAKPIGESAKSSNPTQVDLEFFEGFNEEDKY